MSDSDPPPRRRVLIELGPSEDGVSGWLRPDGGAAVPFSGWLELLALLEPTAA